MNQAEEEEHRAPDWLLSVQSTDEAQRLDVFLSRRCEDCSRSHLKKMIQEGRVTVNGHPVKPGYELRAGDRLKVWFPAVEVAGQLSPQPMSLDILGEDEDILVVNKAPGVVVHPGAGHEEGTLVHGLLAHCPRLATQGAPQRPGIVHRLDQDTSGALVVAKSELAYLRLIEQFKTHRVHKEYLALVYGVMPQGQGEIRTLMDRHPVDRKRMAVAQKKGREAISLWEVEKGWSELSLLRVTIKTGRTHQIRVHLSHVQHPIVGDETYGGGKRRSRALKSQALRYLLEQVDRQMLHAWRLAFEHPRTGAPLSFAAPLPDDFAGLVAKIESVVGSERDAAVRKRA